MSPLMSNVGSHTEPNCVMAVIDSCTDLVERLMPLLLAGEHPCLARLRGQMQVATVSITSNSNWGFYADFSVADSEAPVDPPNFGGGNAVLEVQGLANYAGRILYVREGKLAFLEVYTYDEPWERPLQFGAITQYTPIVPGENSPAGGPTTRPMAALRPER